MSRKSRDGTLKRTMMARALEHLATGPATARELLDACMPERAGQPTSHMTVALRALGRRVVPPSKVGGAWSLRVEATDRAAEDRVHVEDRARARPVFAAGSSVLRDFIRREVAREVRAAIGDMLR